MNHRALIPLALAASLMAAGPARAGTVSVSFENAQRYSDVGPARDAGPVQQALRQHLLALGESRLPAGQSLVITITDIDLAGEIDPWIGRAGGVRVMGRAVDWPRIALRYTLNEGGRTLAEGSERVSDPAYLMHGRLVPTNARLPHEQRMLSTWFSQRFGTQAP